MGVDGKGKRARSRKTRRRLLNHSRLELVNPWEWTAGHSEELKSRRLIKQNLVTN